MMRYDTIKMGDEGDLVEQAQLLLIHHGCLPPLNEYGLSNADKKFGPRTYAATVDFQRCKMRLPVEECNGVISNRTWGHLLGLPEDKITNQPDWPPRPAFHSLSNDEVRKIFGTFDYSPRPASDMSGYPITIHGDWVEKNIRKVYIPQLDGVPLFEPDNTEKSSGFVRLHRLAEKPFKCFFDMVELRGYLPLIKTYDGAFTPRYMRGSRTSLSNHAWGTAIDLNAYANRIGRRPARMGQEGCLLPIVEIANECGLYWGGHFSRPDGMHFEVAVI